MQTRSDSRVALETARLEKQIAAQKARTEADKRARARALDKKRTVEQYYRDGALIETGTNNRAFVQAANDLRQVGLRDKFDFLGARRNPDGTFLSPMRKANPLVANASKQAAASMKRKDKKIEKANAQKLREADRLDRQDAADEARMDAEAARAARRTERRRRRNEAEQRAYDQDPAVMARRAEGQKRDSALAQYTADVNRTLARQKPAAEEERTSTRPTPTSKKTGKYTDDNNMPCPTSVNSALQSLRIHGYERYKGRANQQKVFSHCRSYPYGGARTKKKASPTLTDSSIVKTLTQLMGEADCYALGYEC